MKVSSFDSREGKTPLLFENYISYDLDKLGRQRLDIIDSKKSLISIYAFDPFLILVDSGCYHAYMLELIISYHMSDICFCCGTEISWSCRLTVGDNDDKFFVRILL